MSESPAQPSLLHGHFQYAKGAVETTIGNLTHSDAWKQSGEKDQSEGITEMQAVEAQDMSLGDARYIPVDGSDQSGAALKREGKIEQTVGNLTSCKGMQRVGEKKIHAGEETAEQTEL